MVDMPTIVSRYFILPLILFTLEPMRSSCCSTAMASSTFFAWRRSWNSLSRTSSWFSRSAERS